MNAQDKLARLTRILKKMERVLIGFSGGVDSTFLSRVAQKTLGNKALAVTVVTDFLPRSEKKDAVRIAKKLNLHREVALVRIPRRCLNNPVDRCYYCKKKIFSELTRIAKKKNIAWVLDGSNSDDLNEFRPGEKALKELGVRSPLQEAGMNKKDIRRFARETGIDIWDKPAYTCLATRIPFGQLITAVTLAMVEKAEEDLRRAGFLQSRVRHHQEIARIEVSKKDIPRLIRSASLIAGKLKKIGFCRVTVDLEGYRRGPLQEEGVWKRKK